MALVGDAATNLLQQVKTGWRGSGEGGGRGADHTERFPLETHSSARLLWTVSPRFLFLHESKNRKQQEEVRSSSSESFDSNLSRRSGDFRLRVVLKAVRSNSKNVLLWK